MAIWNAGKEVCTAAATRQCLFISNRISLCRSGWPWTLDLPGNTDIDYYTWRNQNNSDVMSFLSWCYCSWSSPPAAIWRIDCFLIFKYPFLQPVSCLFVFNFAFYFYLCVCVSVYKQVSVGDVRGPKKTLDPLELGLQAILSCLTWVQGTLLQSYGRTASALNWWAAIFLAPCSLLFTWPFMWKASLNTGVVR